MKNAALWLPLSTLLWFNGFYIYVQIKQKSSLLDKMVLVKPGIVVYLICGWPKFPSLPSGISLATPLATSVWVVNVYLWFACRQFSSSNK